MGRTVSKTVDKLTHSEKWIVDKIYTRKELELLMHEVMGFRDWSTWGKYIGFPRTVTDPHGANDYKCHVEWQEGYLEQLKVLERISDDEFKAVAQYHHKSWAEQKEWIEEMKRKYPILKAI